MKPRKFICPACHQKTGVEIVYGMPGGDLAEMEERGEIVLGGCCIDLANPDRQCTACGHTWQIKRRSSTEIPPEFI